MKKYILPGLVFTIATFIALYNIGNFPKMVGDEGIYVSQAYWLIHFGKLGPYTYWYDHFPLGWAQFGLWQLLTGPTRFFGYTVLSARVFMGLILGGTTTLLYLLTHHLTKSKSISILSSCIYITSAITLTFSRMVLLDNIAIFWFLLSLLLLFYHPTRIKYLALSALAASLAILSKESLLFFLPPYLFVVYMLNKHNIHQKYAILINFTTIFFLLSFFPLLAIIKGELFPHVGQVSLLETIFFQAGRGSGLPFWQIGSHFRQMLKVWVDIDPILIILGTGATIITPFLPIPSASKIISIFSLFFLTFIMRGGQIYEFYIIPILPLFSLSISLLISYFNKITKTRIFTYILIIAITTYFYSTSFYPFTSFATESQKQSIDTLKDLGNHSVIIANNYVFLDVFLQNKNQIYWYQKIESDKEIQKSANDITNILVDVQFANELSTNQLPFIKSKLNQQTSIKKFGTTYAPGQNIRPYTTESLNLYQLNKSTQTKNYVLNLADTNPKSLLNLKDNPPYGVLVASTNFTGSQDLEKYLSNLKTILSPTTQIIVTQDDTGSNTIPWITTPARSFYKSKQEAILATTKKSQAIQDLGFTGVIVTSSANQDEYLNTILEATRAYLDPIIRFTGEIPASSGTIVVNNASDFEKLKNSGYSGQILQELDQQKYLEISN